MSGIVWCLGLYASASTWLFNAARQIAATAPGEKTVSHFLSMHTELAPFDRPALIAILKSHEIDDEGTVSELGRRAKAILISTRDPRDAVASMMLYHHHDFEKALGLVAKTATLCARFADHAQAEVWRYESGFPDKPGSIDRIAARMGIQIDPAARERIFANLQRSAVERHIASLPHRPTTLQDRISGDMLDPETHWHTHHAGRTGEIGRWRRMLSEEQARRASKIVLS